ncbi:MAG: glycosyltransferase family 2 protein [Chloroflexi bacterium]|nr:glycosyltransferase family 2 protein [Chloroflexota bacterium]
MNSSTPHAADRLSIVIVNYNTRDDLRACLESLRTVQPPPEIIVVDNASQDGSADMVRAEFPHVRLLALAHNTWFCSGNNVGIEAAREGYILLLNPDTVVQPGALERMVNFLDTHLDYTGVTAQMRYPDGALQRTCSRVPTYAYLLLEHTPLGRLFRGWRARLAAWHWYAGWERDTDKDVEVLPGSCLMARRGFRLEGDLLLYFPEDDLARRTPGAKYRFLAEAVIIHKEKSVTRTWRATQIYFRDLLVYTRKHHGAVRAALLWLLSRPLLWGMALKREISSQRFTRCGNGNRGDVGAGL